MSWLRTFPDDDRTIADLGEPEDGVEPRCLELRADVVGIAPNDVGITRLVGAVLPEANHGWQLQRRFMQTEGMADLTTPQIEDTTTPLITLHAA